VLTEVTRVEMKAGGYHRLLRYRAGTDILLGGTPWRKNTIQGAGITHFLNTMAGNGSAERFHVNTQLRVRNNGGSTVVTYTAQASGYPHTSEYNGLAQRHLLFRWEDRTRTARTDMRHFDVWSPSGTAGE
jgi:hypothetical protein